jgi:hypothetical protein
MKSSFGMGCRVPPIQNTGSPLAASGWAESSPDNWPGLGASAGGSGAGGRSNPVWFNSSPAATAQLFLQLDTNVAQKGFRNYNCRAWPT